MEAPASPAGPVSVGRKPQRRRRRYGDTLRSLLARPELDEEMQDAFRDLLGRFVSMYAFISQIVSYVDRQLERDYLYARALLACLPGQAAERLDLGGEVALTHLKIAQTYEGSASLEEGGGEVVAIFPGRGKEHEPEKEHLSRIVDVMNERFGLELGDADQLLFDQFEESWAADESLAARARNNDFQNFRLVFDRTFLDTVVRRMDDNEEIFNRILDEPEFR
jgi:type I restriction enzyme R subunit